MVADLHEQGHGPDDLDAWAAELGSLVNEAWMDDEWEALSGNVRETETTPWGRFSHLFTMDPAELSGPAVGGAAMADGELLDRIRDCEALCSQLAAEQSRYLVELRRRRLVAQEAEHPHPEGVCTSVCCDDDGWVALEVGQEVGLSERQVQARFDTALALQRHRAVEAAMDGGQVQGWTANRLLQHLSTLAGYVAPDRLARVEAETVSWLLEQPRTVTQLNARMRRLVLAARAAAQADADAGRRPDPDGQPDGGPIDGRRRVWVAPTSTAGLAELVALLPEDDALAVRAMLQSLGHDRVDPDDPRTADQRRADLLVTLITGRVAARGRAVDQECALRDPADLQVRLEVTIPADTLTGGSSPAWLPGYGDLPAATARHLASGSAATAAGDGHQGGAVRPLVYDPGSGRLLGFAATPVRMTWLDGLPPGRGYQHSPSMERAVRLRDGTCRAPGCTRRAARCDCDHVVPYPRGSTSLTNTCCLCRRHHRLKTHAPGWTVRVRPPRSAAPADETDGDVLEWSTPAGRTLRTSVHDYRPVTLDPHAPPEAPLVGEPDMDEPDVPPF